MTNQLAQALGLTVTKTATVVLTATNQAIPGGSALLGSLQLGNLVVSNLPVKCYPRIVGFPASLQIGHLDGLIGLDILKYLRYTIHFNQRYCLLEKPVLTPSGTPRNLLLVTKPYSFNARGIKNPFMCSMTRAVMTLPSLDLLEAKRAKVVKHRTTGLNGSHLVERVDQLKHFSFRSGSYAIRVPKLTFTQREYWIMNIPVAAIMGNKPFRKGLLTVDFPNGQFTYVE